MHKSKEKIYTSVSAADDEGRCPKPHAGSASSSGHWWLLDGDRMPGYDDSVPCVCKTCSKRIIVHADADDLPEY